MPQLPPEKGNPYGIHKGTVTTNIDPEMRGRLLVSVPYPKTPVSLWVEACFPFTGKGVGFYAVPPKGAIVWVMFLAGDTKNGVWLGCTWTSAAELPIKGGPATLPEKVFIGTKTTTLEIDDVASKFELKVKAGAPPLQMTFDPQGILLKNKQATIKMTQHDIEVIHTAAKAVFKKDSIKMEATGKVSIDSNGVKAELSSSKVDITSDSVKIEKSNSIEVKSDEIKIDGGSTISVKSSKVAINDDSLEVE